VAVVLIYQHIGLNIKPRRLAIKCWSEGWPERRTRGPWLALATTVAIVSNPAHDRPPLVVTLSAVVAVGAVGIWLAVHLAVGHEPDLFAAKHRYTARFAQIGGVHPGSKVRYAGVDVGTVRSVSLDSTDPAVVHVVFTVRATTPIRADTRAAIPTLFTPPHCRI
jgi:hypothetical protein